MNKKNNYLLIGNSRLHWALKKENNYQFLHSSIKESIPKEVIKKNLIWASVGKHKKYNLHKDNEIKTKDIKYGNFPKHLGIDRALSCFAALQIIDNLTKKDIIIADFGTTLSITKINYQGNFIGGQLILGLRSQLLSMEKNTKNLIMPNKLIIPKNDFLIDTQEAMIKGVCNSLSGAINLAFNPHTDILIICGGDAEIMQPHLSKKVDNLIFQPNLVMQGMVMYCQR